MGFKWPVVVAAAAATSLHSVSAVAFHGVGPEDESRFADAAVGIKCLDGKASVPPNAVNDDFCDCVDGSDEPGTGACAGRAGKGKGFYCPNEGAAPRYVFPSRVGDGICDCCDGSDEWQTGACRNRCEEQGREHRQRLEQNRGTIERGIEKRRRALESQGSPEIWGARLEKLKTEAPMLQTVLEQRKAQLDAAETLFQASRPEASNGGEGDGAAAGGEKKVSEYAKWMEKDEAAVAPAGPIKTSDLPRKQVEHKVVKFVRVKSGDLVDFVEFHYKEGAPLITGGGKGNAQPDFQLEQDEAIVEVRGGQGGLLDGIEFVTSKGRSSQRYGGKGGDGFAVKAGDGKMIVGLDRGTGTASKLTGIHECTFVDPRSPEERARDEAAEKFVEAEGSLKTVEGEMRSLEARLKGDFKQEDAKDIYELFSEKCGSGNVDKYNYKVCLFGKAEQGHTSLGNWGGWDPKEAGVALFTGGQRCHSGTTRSSRVTLECGEDLKVLRVFEPSQCQYHITMAHPAACSKDSLSGPGKRVLAAHEHDEL